MALTFLAVCGTAVWLCGATQVENPFVGITHISRTETSPRSVSLHIVQIDLAAPGIRFKLTSPGGTRETVRQTTLEFLDQEDAQVAINAHFFLPYPSDDLDASLVGLAASGGNVYSAFEVPAQSYAIVANAPAVNIDPSNRAGIVHRDPSHDDGTRVLEDVTLWNSVAGSAQIITEGVRTIPSYADEQNPEGVLTPGGPAGYSNSNSWYEVANARTVIGLSEDNQTLFLFTVDRAGHSLGMTLSEVADLLIRDYDVHNALNLDGGGSATLAMEDPVTGVGVIVNNPSGGPGGRAIGSSLAVYADTPRTLP